MTSPPVKTAETARFQTAQGVLRAVELRSFPYVKKTNTRVQIMLHRAKKLVFPRLFIAQV